MRKPKIENKCTNCTKSRTCRMAQGVVVWKHCGNFKANLTGIVREVKNEAASN